MESVKLGRGAFDSNCKTTERCSIMCGMCPSCVFAPEPPGATLRPWKASDPFRRKFIVKLVLRCSQDTEVLESLQRALSATSLILYTYARSRRPSAAEVFPRRSAARAPDEKPHGVNLNDIWDWFDSSTDCRKTLYLYRLLSLCDSELSRMVANLTDVLLVRQKRGFLQFNARSRLSRHTQDSDEDSEDPALMVVPGSLESMSGVSRYRDFIGCLPVDLSMRILGLLDEQTLRCCLQVCRYWQKRAQETMVQVKFRRVFQRKFMAMMKRSRAFKVVSPTYANIVEVPVPAEDDESVAFHPCVQKVEPFQAAYAEIKTKTVKMEERNVYCGAYYSKVLLNKEANHQVVDYGGGSLMATGSKDCALRLFYVGSETKVVSVMKGHVGSIRAVLLCEERHLVITASYDSSIWCWDIKTDTCVMALYGHTGSVNCLDVHADRLVSGAKDCLVKDKLNQSLHTSVWSLHTGKCFEDLNFKHSRSVQCVKINTRRIYSSCAQGLIKIWDMENAELLRVIDAHKSSVRCLFFDEWHLLSGDSGGQVMAWSVSCEVKQCLMTFNHPKEVKSLTLVYLRVVTGCADGKIRIFNFLTGDCLTDITVEAETDRILSLHFHDTSILVNTTSSVKLLQFAKVFWDYAESTERGQGDVADKTATSLRKLPHMAQLASPSPEMHNCNLKKPKRAELLHRSTAKCQAQAEQKVQLSEKATSARIKKRGPHHPPSRDAIHLKVSAAQRAQCRDEAWINMEFNARLRDSWGPHMSQDPLQPDLLALKQSPHAQLRRAKTCVPVLRRAVSQNETNTTQRRAKCHSADTHRTIKRVNGFSVSAAERPPTRSLPTESSTEISTSFPTINPVGPCRERRGFRMLTATQLENSVCAERDFIQS